MPADYLSNTRDFHYNTQLFPCTHMRAHTYLDIVYVYIYICGLYADYEQLQQAGRQPWPGRNLFLILGLRHAWLHIRRLHILPAHKLT